jgi:ribose/xylose/arabinose/galactoside ABC-type transport system permease subunit
VSTDGAAPELRDAPVVVADDRTAAAVATRMQLALILQRGAGIVVLIAVLVGGSAAFGPSFASSRNFLNIALASSFLAIVAVGMTFVIISGGIDLSVGSMLALSAVLTAYASRWGSAAAVAVPLVVCGLIGLTNGWLVGKARMAPFIVTLAALLFARGLAFAVSDEGNKTYLIPPGTAVSELGQGTVLGVGMPVVLALATYAIGLVVLNRTRFGQAVYAVGGSQEAAELAGLPVTRVKILLYTGSSLLAAFAGILVAARSSSGLSTVGVGLELEAIAAVVIGGTLLTGGAGSLLGTIAGVLLLGVIQNLINQVGTLTSYYQQVVSGVFLIVVVAVQTLLNRVRRR